MVYLLIAWWIFPWRTVSHNQMVISVVSSTSFFDMSWLVELVGCSIHGEFLKNSMPHLGQCYDAWRCTGPAQTVTQQLPTTDVCHLLYGFKMFHLLLLSIMKHHKTSLFGHISIVKHLGNHWAHPEFDVRRRRGQQQRRGPRDVTN